MDTWKRWMLKCAHPIDDKFEKDTFYFETKEAMMKFAKQDGVMVEKMFHLEDVEFE